MHGLDPVLFAHSWLLGLPSYRVLFASWHALSSLMKVASRNFSKLFPHTVVIPGALWLHSNQSTIWADTSQLHPRSRVMRVHWWDLFSFNSNFSMIGPPSMNTGFIDGAPKRNLVNPRKIHATLWNQSQHCRIKFYNILRHIYHNFTNTYNVSTFFFKSSAQI
jgi:hypothetical protein